MLFLWGSACFHNGGDKKEVSKDIKARETFLSFCNTIQYNCIDQDLSGEQICTRKNVREHLVCYEGKGFLLFEVFFTKLFNGQIL